MGTTSRSVSAIKHVVVLVWQFPKISETFVLGHILGMREHHIDVDILARDASHELLQHRAVSENGLLDRTHVISPRLRTARRLAFLRGLAAAARRYPKARRYLWRYPPESDLVRALGAAAELGQAVQIVHAHFGPNGIFAGKLIAGGVFPGAKLVTSFHGYDATSYVTEQGPGVYAKLFAQGDAFLANGNDMRERLFRLGCDWGKIAVLPIGIDLPPARERAPTVHSPPRVLSIGRLVEKKGHAHGIRAIAEVAKRYPEIEYHIVGDGPLRDSLGALARDLGLERNVVFRGLGDADDVSAALEWTDVLLTPSVTASNGDSEGMVVANMEAMARQIPVVSTRHASIPELIEEGVSGLLCDEGDVTCLSEALISVIDDCELREKLGRGGRAKIAAKHDRRKADLRLLEIYDRVLRGLSPA